MSNESKLLKLKECADFGGVHINTIRNLIRSGKLPAVRLGRNILRVNQQDLEALFTSYKGGEYGIWSR